MGLLIVDIVTEAVRAGQRLPNENDLADQFGVSRGVVRESLRGLEERGLVTVRHGRGAIVSPPRNWNLLDADVLTTILQSNGRLDVLAEFLECRRIFEIEAAGLAAERATGEDLTRLADAFSRMAATAERAALSAAAEDVYHEADIEFHAAVIAASGNRVLSRLVQPVQHALIVARRPTAHPEARIERSLPEHKRILSAIASRNPDAARAAMADHLATSQTYLREYARNFGSVEQLGQDESA